MYACRKASCLQKKQFGKFPFSLKVIVVAVVAQIIRIYESIGQSSQSVNKFGKAEPTIAELNTKLTEWYNTLQY